MAKKWMVSVNVSVEGGRVLACYERWQKGEHRVSESRVVACRAGDDTGQIYEELASLVGACFGDVPISPEREGLPFD
jgi:hypothetical protein